MNWREVSVVVCLLLASGSAHPEIYRWVDSKGKKHFSDKPPQRSIGKKKASSVEGRAQLISNSHNLSQQQKPIFTPSLQNNTTLKIRTWLKREEFAKLTQFISGLQLDTEQNIENEHSLFRAFEAFGTRSDRTLLKLDRWVAEEPQNYIAYLARAQYMRTMGWKKRGNRWASETGSDQFSDMESFFQKATADLKNVLKIKPDSLLAYYYLLDMAGALGSDQAEIFFLQKALDIEPASYHIRRLFVLRLAPRWGGEHDAMDNFALKALKHASDNPRLKALQGFRYFDQARIKNRNRAYSEAEELYSKALSFGSDEKFYYRRAINRLKREDYLPAIADLSQAIELNPDNGNFYYQRARAYKELKYYGKAFTDILLADELKPGDRYIQGLRSSLAGRFEQLGYAAGKKHNYVKALAHYETAMKLMPSSVLYHRKATVLAKMNRMEEALIAVKESIRLDQTYMNAYHLLDYILAKRKDWSQIISYWNQLIRLDPINSRAYLERGGAYFHKGDIHQAVADAKMAADLGSIEGKETYEKYRHRVK